MAVPTGPLPRSDGGRKERLLGFLIYRFTEQEENLEAYLPHFNVLVVYFFSLRKNSPSTQCRNPGRPL